MDNLPHNARVNTILNEGLELSGYPRLSWGLDVPLVQLANCRLTDG
jgi:hypothetical protein